MNPRDILSEDGQAILTLCTAFGLTSPLPADAPTPFTLAQWNQLERQIQASPWQTPGALLGRSAEELAEGLAVPLPDAERVARLLERSAAVALEVENLFARGLWAASRVDAQYPAPLRDSLKHQAPVVLFGAGDLDRLQRRGIGVVGSRNLDPAGQAFALEVGRRCAQAGVPLISGGARGTDRLAMQAALEAGGVVHGVLADSLEQTVRTADLRRLVMDGQLVFLTPYVPTAGFSVGGAMGRNKIIYGLAQATVVVSSDLEKGGTWAGAVEALKAGWCPVFVRSGEQAPPGNTELIRRGAVPIDDAGLSQADSLTEWLQLKAGKRLTQGDLFG